MKTTRFAMLLVSLIAVQTSLVARATEMAGPLQSVEPYRCGEAYAIPGEFVTGYGIRPTAVGVSG
jgi:hypothetical protein